MKKLIFSLFLAHMPLLSGSMCSSSALAQTGDRAISTSTVTSTIKLNKNATIKCKLRALARPVFVKKLHALLQKLATKIKLTTPLLLELNNSTTACPEEDPCFVTATAQGEFVIHIYPKLFKQCTADIKAFLLGRLLIQIRDYPQTLTAPFVDSTKMYRIVINGISQSLITFPDKAHDLAYQQLDQLSLMESPYENVIRIVLTSFLKGIGLAAQTYAQEKINTVKELTLSLDSKSAKLADDHCKGAKEYLERRNKLEQTWSKVYLWLKSYCFGYVKASERLDQLT